MISPFCTAHPALHMKITQLGNGLMCISRTWYCFSIHGPSKEVRCTVDKSVHEAHYLRMQIMTLKEKTQETF